MDVTDGLWRRLNAGELMLSNCSAEEDSWECLGLQGDPTTQSWRKSALNIQPFHFIGRTAAEAEAPILWPPDAKTWLIRKDPDAEKDWRREEKGTDRGGDGWMASLTQWTSVWVNSRSWWWTGRPGVLQSMGSQRAGHNWATELNRTDTVESDFWNCGDLSSNFDFNLKISV